MIQDHSIKAFDVDMAGMRSAVMEIGSLVEQQLVRATDALLLGHLPLVTKVLEGEEMVNRLHSQADRLCQQVIARRQPIAVDLREVIAALHSINDLERIGDEAKKIALRARRLNASMAKGHCAQWPKDKFAQMVSLAIEMLASALDSYVRLDNSVAFRLAERDKILDQLREEMNEILFAYMAGHADEVQSSMDIVFAVQALERIGDHAKNIAEHVVSIVEGVDRRHWLN